jgi:hypothetical protein|tara:strand:- start:3143 stop:3385 length:243 start_codon:yes stop_codon:yes gene_type:complete
MTSEDKKELVQSQIKNLNKELEEELGMKLNKKVWDLVNNLIIKTNQYYQINYDINMDTLTRVYAESDISGTEHIRKENTK